MGLKVLTEQGLATTAVEALSAELRVVSADAFSDLEPLHILADSSDDTNSLVA